MSLNGTIFIRDMREITQRKLPIIIYLIDPPYLNPWNIGDDTVEIRWKTQPASEIETMSIQLPNAKIASNFSFEMQTLGPISVSKCKD